LGLGGGGWIFFEKIGGGGGGSAARLTPLYIRDADQTPTVGSHNSENDFDLNNNYD